MSVEDKLTNVAVRRILTSLWVDITLVNVRTTGGVVYVSGYLKRMTASHTQFDQLGLREMDLRLRKIRGVRDLKYRLDNWRRNVDGGWSTTAPGESVTFVIDEPTAESGV